MSTEFKGIKTLSIKEVACESCNKSMKIAWGVTSYASGGKVYYGVSSLGEKELAAAKMNGVIIQEASNKAVLANVCPHCGALRNNFSIQDCMDTEDEKIEVASA